MTNAITVKGVSKQYGRDKLALDHIDLHMIEGRIYGLLGPNGAGKSTLMKLISGIMTDHTGDIELFGIGTNGNWTRLHRNIGYVPQEITLYERLSARQNLLFFGRMHGLRGKRLKQRVSELLKQIGLEDRAGDEIRTYSGGMKRRVNIAAALLHGPKLVIMDEPTVGIDPQSRNHIFEMIRSLREEGITVLYSTHYMEEVEALCDEVAILDHGKVIASGTLSEVLQEHALQAVYVESEGIQAIPSMEGITATIAKGQGWVVESDNALQTLHQLSEMLIQKNVKVKQLQLMQPSLEQVFLKLTGTKLRDMV